MLSERGCPGCAIRAGCIRHFVTGVRRMPSTDERLLFIHVPITTARVAGGRIQVTGTATSGKAPDRHKPTLPFPARKAQPIG
jgi:hypothetical protein